MSTRDDIMKDYVPVNERIGAFLAKHPEGSLQSELVDLSENRVVMRAYAYRTPDDARPGIGYSSLEIPGRTPYTRGSEIENCETSAWGRAIAALGFEVKRGIATAEEVANKKGEPDANGALPPVIEPNVETEELVGLTPKKPGMVRNGGAEGYKLEARQGPDGYNIGFKLETDKGGIPQVIVSGPAGDALFMATGQNPAALLNTRISVKGRLVNVKRPGARSYHRLHVTEWEWDDFKFPATDEPLEEPPADIPLFGEKVSAA